MLFGSANVRASYRQGVVLGLSMAELMLVLLCAVTLLFSVRVQALHRENEDLKRQVEVSLGLPAPKPAEGGRASRSLQIFAELEQQGIDPAALPAIAPVIRAAQGISANGLTPEQIASILQAAEGLVRPPGSDAEQLIRTLRDIQNLVDRGVSLQEVMIDPAVLEALAKLRKEAVTAEEILAMLQRLPKLPGGGGDLNQPETRWPPIIRLTETAGYTFEGNSFELSPSFRNKLDEVAEHIVQLASAYGTDVVEVSGHTDDRSVQAKNGVPLVSNLDDTLIPVLNGLLSVDTMKHSDNVGLGMARAVAVVHELRKDPRLFNLTLIPVSAAFLVDNVTGEVVTEQTREDVADRRRIEIRLMKRQ